MDDLSVLHVAPHLAQGGAERVLHAIVTHPMPGQRHSLLLMEDEAFFDCSGVEVASLGFDFSARLASIARLYPAMRALRRRVMTSRPDVVVGWLYYGAFLTRALRRTGVPVVWSIHNSTLPGFKAKPMLHTVDRLLARSSSRVPAAILYCAETARGVHERNGYAAGKGTVVGNGIDMTAFRADAMARAGERTALGIAPGQFAVVFCARFDAQKNVMGALDAFKCFRHDAPEAVLLLAGRGMDAANEQLTAAIAARGLSSHCRLFGPLKETASLMRAGDVVMLASTYGEAMPLVLLEALATQTPVAATLVGDVGALPVPQQVLAEPGNPVALARALAYARATAGDAVWQDAYRSVRQTYALERCVAGYAAVFSAVAGSRARGEALA